MLRLKPVLQYPSYCAPACLEMISSYFGREISQKEWGRRCKTTLARGTAFEQVRLAAVKSGFSVVAREHASFKDIQRWLRKKIPVMVNWFSTDEGHYSIAVKLDRRFIWLMDPEMGKVHKLERKTFMRVWFGLRHEPMRTVNDLALRRMVAIFPKTERE